MGNRTGSQQVENLTFVVYSIDRRIYYELI